MCTRKGTEGSNPSLSATFCSGKTQPSASRLQNLSKNFADRPSIEQCNRPLPRLGEQVHVALRRAEVHVSGELLDGLGRRSAHGQVAAKGVAQHVNAASLARRAGL